MKDIDHDLSIYAIGLLFRLELDYIGAMKANADQDNIERSLIYVRSNISTNNMPPLSICNTSSTNSTIGHDTTPDEQYCMKTAALDVNMGFGPIP